MRPHRARARGWHPGGHTAELVLGPPEPTRGAVLHWLEAQVLRGQPVTLQPENAAFILRELKRETAG